ncbi:MAG: hypothetical protein JWL62_3486 [Hyphomicrobiales bacterium]|nr:hypothetical protein [Hyphomicrobiales bacterium]
MVSMKRRAFVRGAAATTFLFTVGGIEQSLTPAQACAQGAALKKLTPEQADLLGAYVEALVPGARAAGIAQFVDQQCSVPPHEALLGLRIANGNPPFVDFYVKALAEIDRQSNSRFGKSFEEMSGSDQRAFIDLLRQAKLEDWRGPQQPQVYNVLRDDGVDVVYGTVEGFALLGVPYMPHVLPTARW